LNYNNLLKPLIETSYLAGEKILEIYNDNNYKSSIEIKKDTSPLTIADKASNNVIVNSLNKINNKIPILSEEEREIDYSTRKKWNLFWLVDPLDGTKEFIKRNGEFTVNIALIENNTPIMGFVYAPVLNKLWYGLKNHGSFVINDKNNPTKILKKEPSEDTIKIVSSRSHANNEKLKNYLKQFKKYELVNMGSSIKMCLVADGSAHYYPRFGPTMEWDTGAAHAVIKYANGNIYNIDTDEELVYNKENLLNPGFIVK
jgi:3'(2'), 5'-bisphosphate nucleotidase